MRREMGHVFQALLALRLFVIVGLRSKRIFSERANIDINDISSWKNSRSRFRSLYAVARPSVCLSVCRPSLQRSCGLPKRLKFSAIFLRHLVP